MTEEAKKRSHVYIREYNKGTYYKKSFFLGRKDRAEDAALIKSLEAYVAAGNSGSELVKRLLAEYFAKGE